MRKIPRDYHPICHYVHGERLYYLLLKAHTKQYEVGENVREALRDNGLEDSSCAYFLFGDTDIIVRVWSTEDRIERLKTALSALEAVEQPFKCLLVSGIETWYQREIEARKGWSEALTSEGYEEIWKWKIPDKLAYRRQKPAAADAMRFFVFIKEPLGKNKILLDSLRHAIRAGGYPAATPAPGRRAGKHALFSKGSRISLYSCYGSDFSGVIMKGQSSNFAKTAPDLVQFALDQKKVGRETTTYICSKRIKIEANGIATSVDLGMAPNIRRPQALQNLLLNDACTKQVLDREPSRTWVANHFVRQLVDLLPQIFHFHKGWWRHIKDLRYLYKWCVLADNEQLLAFLTRSFAEMERMVAAVVGPPFAERTLEEGTHRREACLRKIQAILRRTLAAGAGAAAPSASLLEGLGPTLIDTVTRELKLSAETLPTMQPMAIFLSRLAKVSSFSEGERVAIARLAQALHDGAPHRNFLMHGRIQDLFQIQKGAEAHPWEAPVFAFIALRLAIPHALPILERWVSERGPSTASSLGPLA